MTVGELIDLLKKYDPSQRIGYFDDQWGECADIESIEENPSYAPAGTLVMSKYKLDE